MEIPIYYSFTEFCENYNSDYQNWKRLFPDGSEKIYLNKVLQLYQYEIDPIYYETKDIEFDVTYCDPVLLKDFTKSVKIDDLCNELDTRVLYYVRQHGLDIWDEFICSGYSRFKFLAENNIFDTIVSYEDVFHGILSLEKKKSIYSNVDYLYDGNKFKKWESFANFHTITDDELEEIEMKNEYTVGSFIDFDRYKYENYKISISRIYDWIKEKLTNTVSPQPTLAIPQPITPENDFSDSKPKERVILLEKLGVIDFVKNLQSKPDTITHTAEILSAITGISSATLYSYLLPMLQPNRNDTDKNSPYKNLENLKKANKTLHKLNLKDDIETDANF